MTVEVERLDSGASWAPEEECDVTEALLLSQSVDFAEDGVSVGGEVKPQGVRGAGHNGLCRMKRTFGGQNKKIIKVLALVILHT